jgi:hypothetical protein
MENIKKRSLNELRQEKEYGYKTPLNQVVNKKINLDPQYIVDLMKKYPNDADLGKNVRSYLIHLGVYGK